MNVSEVMTRDVVTCSLEDSLNDAARRMWEHDCGAVPVTDAEDRVVGMITDRDICMAAYTRGLPLDQMKVSSAASSRVYLVHEDATLKAAEALMSEHKIRRVPVVDRNGRAIGLLSLNDLARNLHLDLHRGNGLSAESIAHTLSAICEPPAAE